MPINISVRCLKQKEALRQRIVRQSHATATEEGFDRALSIRLDRTLVTDAVGTMPYSLSTFIAIRLYQRCNASANLQGEVMCCCGQFVVYLPIHAAAFTDSLMFQSTTHQLAADRAKQSLPASFCGGRFRARVGFQPTWCIDGSRTRDRQVISLMLYPLSYFNRCCF